MHRIRVYVDTSVFGGTQDDEFQDASKNFFRLVGSGGYVILVSDETLRELADAPEEVRAAYEAISRDQLERVAIDKEVLELAQAYVGANVLGKASISDAVHVAAATVTGADLILSWNFKHIVNFNRIRGFNGVNVSRGYRQMTILSPLEVDDDDQDENL